MIMSSHFFKKVKQVLTFSLLIVLLSCGNSDPADTFITDKEYLILENVNFYLKNQFDLIDPPEVRKDIEKFLVEVPDESVDSSNLCHEINVEDIIQLMKQDNKSRWLREKGYLMYDYILPDKDRLSKNLSRDDRLKFIEFKYGSCRYPKEKMRGNMMLGALAGLARDISNFRTKISVLNHPNTYSAFELTDDKMKDILSEIRSKGKRIKPENNLTEFEENSETYKYEELIWDFDNFHGIDGKKELRVYPLVLEDKVVSLKNNRGRTYEIRY